MMEVGNKMNFMKISALVGATILAAPPAMAASIMIDDFTVFQRAADLTTADVIPGTPPTVFIVEPSSIAVDASLFGGSRVFQIENTTPPPSGPSSGGLDLVSTADSPTNPSLPTFNPANVLQLNASAGQVGSATVIYDGRATLAETGSTFGMVQDLTDGGLNDRFFFDLVEDTLNFPGATFTTTVTSLNTMGADFEASLVEDLDQTFSPFTTFASFLDPLNPLSNPNIDFSKVTSLAFSFNTSGVAAFDQSIRSVSVVPLPLSALLLLGGLGGLASVSVVSKRRRKA